MGPVRFIQKQQNTKYHIADRVTSKIGGVTHTTILSVRFIRSELRDYCEDGIFRAECPMGEIVVVEEAQFGRMELGTCLQLDIGFMNCYR